ncbi:phospholipid-transporting ATPase [Verticillium alfalfae VaMs.102]|uniref:Phospholipid-transporting ATPase n=1 Tax=Verticillium alfalfae (strain VaMs.102 / ATCC MYA-4576 / FGSC 10136) TaxID=526221 RepID=C9S8T1_VERA1|nr:phospholipid-transporting ATPase [Verticillium alfalfae VaMs.102]EEY14008.1 phospholipid-transporting ATPase [Verticillium alfalfae VaMs.102]
MPPNSSYRPAEPPDSPNDSDSDLDLDIQELDPATTSQRGSAQARHARDTGESRSPRIALRNLRMGGLRRGNRSRGYGELGQDRDGAADDSQSLLGGGHRRSTSQSADGSRASGDDAPLLSGRSQPRSRRRSSAQEGLGRLAALGSSLKLGSFMGGSGAPGSVKDDSGEAEEEEDDPSAARHIAVGSLQSTKFPPNLISNAKYTALSFLPVTLYNEFSFFFNMYFLLVALSQAIPALRIGYLTTYVAPLAFVLMITMGKEAYDDIERRRRDNEANAEAYTVLRFDEPGRALAPGLRPHKRLKSESTKRRGKKLVKTADRLSDIREEEERMEGDGPRLLETEINSLTKILCALTLALSVILVALLGFENTEENRWYIKIMRYLVLFSTIVPISLRVNLDMGKSAYSWFIHRDSGIPGTVVRTSTIPEDLGRIEYLLSDKTGTLTQNEMEMKKIHVGTVSYANEAMDEVVAYVKQGFHIQSTVDPASQKMLITPSSTFASTASVGTTRTRREIGSRVRDVVLALALCHNVTPTTEEEDGKTITSYQASSPDEIAIVRWTESVGLRLVHRDRTGMILEYAETGRPTVQVRILDVFPFTSEGKRMGIIVQFYETKQSSPPDLSSGQIWFYQKGADTVMTSIVAENDWLDEETANMAREGLRTLVVGRRRLSYEQCVAVLERDLELLGVTGVEDKLQKDVKPSLELLRNAGVKIWMLTGDKVETARCVAVSSRLVARGQYIYTVSKLKRKDNAQDHLDFLRSKTDACLLVDGESLLLFLTHFRIEFISVAVQLPTVVACRCSPTQKAEVATLIKEYTKKRVCCIGDGGNDVSMIQAADVGVGIVGKEGRQASLAADFSIEQFHYLTKLLVWHGRNSYKRSAKLAQFVIHRGLIIAVCQTMYSIAIKFEPQGLYKDWLLVGYATVYTAFPVLSLVLDKDVDENLANLYPELYKELTSGRSLSYRTFLIWVLVSVYQGCVIQGLSQILTEVHGPRMVAVSYTVLVLNELLMVAMEITTWHPVMIVSIVGTFMMFAASIPFLGDYFELEFLLTL